MKYGYVFFFFFSSRRRHTRWPRDWSSDVCSSDLGGGRARRPSQGAGGGLGAVEGAGGRARSLSGEPRRVSPARRALVQAGQGRRSNEEFPDRPRPRSELCADAPTAGGLLPEKRQARTGGP